LKQPRVHRHLQDEKRGATRCGSLPCVCDALAASSTVSTAISASATSIATATATAASSIWLARIFSRNRLQLTLVDENSLVGKSQTTLRIALENLDPERVAALDDGGDIVNEIS